MLSFSCSLTRDREGHILHLYDLRMQRKIGNSKGTPISTHHNQQNGIFMAPDLLSACNGKRNLLGGNKSLIKISKRLIKTKSTPNGVCFKNNPCFKCLYLHHINYITTQNN